LVCWKTAEQQVLLEGREGCRELAQTPAEARLPGCRRSGDGRSSSAAQRSRVHAGKKNPSTSPFVFKESLKAGPRVS